MRDVLTEREFVYVRDGFIPDLAPHMRAATASSVEAVLGRKRTEVEAQAFFFLERGDLDTLGCVRLREKQHNVAVISGALLGVRRDVGVLCVDHEFCGQGLVGAGLPGAAAS